MNKREEENLIGLANKIKGKLKKEKGIKKFPNPKKQNKLKKNQQQKEKRIEEFGDKPNREQNQSENDQIESHSELSDGDEMSNGSMQSQQEQCTSSFKDLASLFFYRK